MATHVHGSYRVPFPPKVVWEALFDPAVIKSAIPGCKRLRQNSPTDFEADIQVTIGPFTTVFRGGVTVEDRVPPNSCLLVGQGHGGLAGYFKGTSKVTFDEVDGKTILSYAVNAQTGGKLEFIADILINAFAQRFSDVFFERFSWAIIEKLGLERKDHSPAAGQGGADTPWSDRV